MAPVFGGSYGGTGLTEVKATLWEYRMAIAAGLFVLVALYLYNKRNDKGGFRSHMQLGPKSGLDNSDALMQDYNSRMNTNAMRAIQGQTNLMTTPKAYNIGSDAPDAQTAAALLAAQNSGRLVNYGGAPCRIAASNNFPSGTVCTPQWSDDAVGDAMALASLQAYNMPSLEKEPNMERTLGYTFDTVNPQCVGAADVAVSGFSNGAVGQTYNLKLGP